jgi:hypothetical protein
MFNFLLLEPPDRAALLQFREKKMKKGGEGASLFSLFGFRGT